MAQTSVIPRAKPKQAEYITLDAWREMTKPEQQAALATVGNAKFNQQSNESIGWAKWSWNPVTGCQHTCPYCYARDIAVEKPFDRSLST